MQHSIIVHPISYIEFKLGLNMQTPEELLKHSENRLNGALADYEASPSSALAHEFYELRIQAAIFNYDVCYDITSIWRAAPTGFAEKVALKSIIHRLYEYDQLMQKHLVKRLLTLSEARNIGIYSEDLRALRKRWREQLKHLESWSSVRNKATGHYGNDLQEQVILLKAIDRSQVMDVVKAFLSYNIKILNVLKDAGQGRNAV